MKCSFYIINQYLITNLKLVWNPMLSMSLIVHGILFLHDNMKLLLDMLDLLKIIFFFIFFYLNMGGCCWWVLNGNNYINWDHWLEPKEHLKRIVANRSMERLLYLFWTYGRILSHVCECLVLYISKTYTIILLNIFFWPIWIWNEIDLVN